MVTAPCRSSIAPIRHPVSSEKGVTNRPWRYACTKAADGKCHSSQSSVRCQPAAHRATAAILRPVRIAVRNRALPMTHSALLIYNPRAGRPRDRRPRRVEDGGRASAPGRPRGGARDRGSRRCRAAQSGRARRRRGDRHRARRRRHRERGAPAPGGRHDRARRLAGRHRKCPGAGTRSCRGRSNRSRT